MGKFLSLVAPTYLTGAQYAYQHILGHVQRMTNRLANFNSDNPLSESVFKQIAEELIIFQRLLMVD
ncbi:hypothetical protein [uncultured Herbaspirillum sp.]|uniref:hypothetical protein n=1 Tax=uncultured Herbaspirillum sp. TaxID=160236 RepID=UPI002608C451|nr:hypothetical protein [uncultured Herbaspirillum sp.]